ncbi:chorismate mutase [Bordetella sp. 2513F-2]
MADTRSELPALQAEVDEIDQQILLLLGVRFRCTDRIGELEREHGLSADGPHASREARRERIRALTLDSGVPTELAVTLLDAIMDAVEAEQRRQRERYS